ncbi:MAG: CPBP family glutamic-type intramembrane protease [Syntrophorhabdaceae bacterium]|nr:CPBP family glutamic-type intramembrane protease [Syntrophorhabdaceae bacterium]
MKIDRLFAYSPNLKQSWMLYVILFGCFLVIGLVAIVIKILTVINILPVLTPEWKDPIIELLSIVVTVAVVIRLSKNSYCMPVVFPSQSLLLWLLLVPFILSVSIAIELLTMWIPKIIDISRFQNNLFMFISLVIIAPVLEEWLNRGVILKGLLTHYSPLKAIIWSAVIFGVIHIDPNAAVSAFCGGLAMGWVYWRTRSLLCCILMHAAHNAATFLIIKLYIPTETTFVDIASGYYIYAIVAVVCVLTGMWVNKIMISPDAAYAAQISQEPVLLWSPTGTKKKALLVPNGIVAAVLLAVVVAGGFFVWQSSDSGVKIIEAGGWHSFAIKKDGSLWAWGSNYYGELGDGTKRDRPKREGSVGSVGVALADSRKNRLSPKKIMDSAASVSVAITHTIAVKKDGSLWAWGSNDYGELGDGTTQDRPKPVKIMDFAASVSAGGSHSMAIKKDGSLWVWGSNKKGQLGDSTTQDRHKPVKIMDSVAYVSAGGSYSMAIKTDGTLWAWGGNSDAALGDGTKENILTPVKIMDSVAYVSAGSNHTLAIKTDGSLWAWGRNFEGQLGDDTGGSLGKTQLEPVKIMDSVAGVSAGFDHTVAIKTDGGLWAWGDNDHGQLCDGTTQGRHKPVKIIDSAASASAGNGHTLVMKTDGSLWACGRNLEGQLGNGAGGHSPKAYINSKLVPIK